MKKTFVLCGIIFSMVSCFADDEGGAKRILTPRERQKPAPVVAKPEVVVSLSSEDVLKEALATHEFVVVDFYATWCPACKAFNPVVVDIAKSFKEKIKFFKVETSNLEKWKHGYHIDSIPTLIFFRDGEEVFRSTGVFSKEKLELIVKTFIE